MNPRTGSWVSHFPVLCSTETTEVHRSIAGLMGIFVWGWSFLHSHKQKVFLPHSQEGPVSFIIIKHSMAGGSRACFVVLERNHDPQLSAFPLWEALHGGSPFPIIPFPSALPSLSITHLSSFTLYLLFLFPSFILS